VREFPPIVSQDRRIDTLAPAETKIYSIELLLISSMQSAAVVHAAGHGKDGSTTRPQSPPKLLLVTTGFVAAVLLLLLLHGGGGGFASPTLLPRLDALSACAREEEEAKAAGLERWTRAPASAWHNMSDEELLWAASWRPSVRRYPYRRTPKVAFMFLTRGPLPLAPLWERFFAGGDRGHYSVYVHTTPGYQPDFRPASVFYRRQVPSQVGYFALPSFQFPFPARRGVCHQVDNDDLLY
jgi:hypothetical protein